ncbi:Endonuclease/exonuclease/phosphatase [Chiua virens]|nr:Endonuclease/exonuclease/phosphatase [Chiua virens]
MNERLLVQIGSYNTSLQAGPGLPQDLVDWLAPTLQVSSFLSKEQRAPDLVAIGFQELLPLHLGLAGRSRSVIDEKDAHIRAQIETHAPNKESYSLVAKVVNVGVALLVYARDETIARRVCDVQAQWTGTGPAYMGNKGAVGVRFRVADRGSQMGETFTLSPHSPDTSLPGDTFASQSAIHHHVHYFSSFFLGDLNFRVAIPPSHPLRTASRGEEAQSMLSDEKTRETLKEYDQLINERRKGRVFIGLREGPFWTFKCTYKCVLGEVDKYNIKRVPSWTDRIMYTTYTDSPATPDKSDIDNILYTSIPSYVTSDHKPVVSLLLLPAPQALPTASPSTTAEEEPPANPPRLRLPLTYTPIPDPLASIKKYTGRTLDRIVGYTWWLLVVAGAGSTVVGIFNFCCMYASWKWLGRWWWGPSNGNGIPTTVDAA